MYVPEAFRLDDPRRIAELMRAHDFALLVTAPEGVPQATHLPFLYDPEPVSDAGPAGTLLAHMARPNPQWRDFEEPERVRALLERLVATQEAGLDPAWSTAGLTEKYLAGMQRGLVAFEIPVSRLEAKAKLSQNKPASQLAAATAVLEGAEAPLGRQTGAWMRRALEEKG